MSLYRSMHKQLMALVIHSQDRLATGGTYNIEVVSTGLALTLVFLPRLTLRIQVPALYAFDCCRRLHWTACTVGFLAAFPDLELLSDPETAVLLFALATGGFH